MLKCLFTNFSRNLIISQVIRNEHLIQRSHLPKLPDAVLARFLTTDAHPDEPVLFKHPRSPLDADDYITPYDHEKESTKGMNKHLMLATLLSRYRLSEKQVETVLNSEVAKRNRKDFTQTLDILLNNGITKASVLEYPWLVGLEPKSLQVKVATIRAMQLRDFNDFVPFLKLSPQRLKKLISFLVQESHNLEQDNRIYFISERLLVEPKIVSKYLSKRLFILEMPYELLCANLNIMMNYGVKPLNILKDLWAFRYTPKSVKTRLERAKCAKKDKIMPWMVRCPERILERSLQISLEDKKLLGEHSNVIEYVASRLGFSPESTKAIMSKHPAVHGVRVTKIKEVLDYLLNDAKFTPYDIANVPRILCHSLETTKERLNELESMGCRPTSLIIVCRSKREYEKFINAWLETKEKIRARQEKKDTQSSD